MFQWHTCSLAVCHVPKQLSHAIRSYGMNRDEELKKQTMACLDLLQQSQLPGHHCLKCVVRIQYLYVWVHVCVFVNHIHLSCVYMSHFVRYKAGDALVISPSVENIWATATLYTCTFRVEYPSVRHNETELIATTLLSEVKTTFRNKSMKSVWCNSLGCFPQCCFEKVCLCCYDAERPYVFTCGLKCVIFSSGLCSRWGMFNRSTSLMTTQIHCY